MSACNENRREQPEFLPAIRRGRIDCLRIYDVTEQELEQLRQGAPGSTYLNFAIGLLSATVTLVSVLLVTPIPSVAVRVLFIILTFVSFVNGCVLMCIWLGKRKATSDLVDVIRKRMPPEAIQETTSSLLVQTSLRTTDE